MMIRTVSSLFVACPLASVPVAERRSQKPPMVVLKGRVVDMRGEPFRMFDQYGARHRSNRSACSRGRGRELNQRGLLPADHAVEHQVADGISLPSHLHVVEVDGSRNRVDRQTRTRSARVVEVDALWAEQQGDVADGERVTDDGGVRAGGGFDTTPIAPTPAVATI
ncbi:MAG: hypothetical protein ACI89X_004977, partial [Planctomycetota bacterium]